MPSRMSPRTTYAVFREHLALRRANKVAQDIRRNYSPAVVALTTYGVFRGHKGVLECSRRLKKALPKARFRYIRQLVFGELAFLVWTATSASGRRIDDGVDTFVIRDGRIVLRTVHYTVARARR